MDSGPRLFRANFTAHEGVHRFPDGKTFMDDSIDGCANRHVDLESPGDQVNGARTSEQGQWKIMRVTAKWIIRMIAIYLSGQSIPDLNTGLKAFKRSIMLKYQR